MPNISPHLGAASLYPAGLAGEDTQTPPEGISRKIRAVHHSEALGRQLRVFRGYPYWQANTCGQLSTLTNYGLFQAAPHSESFTISFVVGASEIDVDTEITLEYDSVAFVKNIGPNSSGSGFAKIIFGPWAMASAPGDQPAEVVVEFSIDTGTIRVFSLRALFSSVPA